MLYGIMSNTIHIKYNVHIFIDYTNKTVAKSFVNSYNYSKILTTG